ncbi:MAG: YtrH family sporulation protein [Clostridia bacterium]|nr:YtrH family sporulation protein [Clostridia bacterium]
MDKFSTKIVIIFFTALGVMLGSALIGSIGAVFTGQNPLRAMLKIAGEMKIWAIVAAIGGTFSSIEVLESGIFQGQVRAVVKQLLYIFSAFWGAHLGHLLLTLLAGVKE